MVRFTCPGCQTILQAKPSQVGVPLTCPQCRQIMRIPAPVARRVDDCPVVANSPPRPFEKVSDPNFVALEKPQISRGFRVTIFVVAIIAICCTSWVVTWIATKKPTEMVADKSTQKEPEIAPGVPSIPLDTAPPIAKPASTNPDPLEWNLPRESKPSSELAQSTPFLEPTTTPLEPLVESNPGPGAGVIDPKVSMSRDQNWFVCFPRDGQEGVPLEFTGNEIPDPLPNASNKLTGYPLTITFAPASRVQKAQAELLDEQNQNVPCWISTPEQPANSNHLDVQANTICLFSKKPLQSNRRYTLRATAQVNQKPWSHEIHFRTINSEIRDQNINGIVLERINSYRKIVSLAPVVLDPETSNDCWAHARYLALNLPKNEGLNWNDEQDSLPGTTPGGRRVATGAAIFLGGGPIGLIDWMFSSFYNRHSLLDPSLAKIGLGYASFPGRGSLWVLRARATNSPSPSDKPILFPTPGQRDVPTTYPSRSNPLPLPKDEKDHDLGYAITARFPANQRLENIQVELFDGDKQQVPFYLSSPQSPAVVQLPQYWIGIVPREPLQQGVTYTVHLSGELNRNRWQKSWSFTTAKMDEKKERELAEFAMDRLNRIRHQLGLGKVKLDETLSRGCRLHALYLVRHQQHPSTQGIGMHDESPKLEGFTPEGQNAGRSGVIASDANPKEFIDGWIATLYHRIPLLHPNLQAVGFGLARLPDQNWISVMDCISDLRRK